jgi:quercetin dioxygenase-like cupin family protein
MMTSVPQGTPRPEEPRRRLHAPLVSFDVPFEIARLRATAAYEAEGHAGQTLAKAPEMRVVLEAMKTGTRLPFHGTPERVTLQVMIGQLRVWLEHGDNYDLADGAFVAIEAGRVYEVDCLEECAFVLTLAWPPAHRGTDGAAGPAE